jgi:hypothetical protein
MGRARASGRNSEGELTVSGYFRKIFEENPRLLKSRSNAELLQKWLIDHPEDKEVPKRVRQCMMNVKSILRKRGRMRRRRQEGDEVEGTTVAAAPIRRLSGRLEQLEEQIDDCLTAARLLDRQGLEFVIRLLRQARNQVVWKMGQ